MNMQGEKNITIVVVGSTDNGKSTLINSWFQRPIAEANEEDCTSSIHNFHIFNNSEVDTADVLKKIENDVVAHNSNNGLLSKNKDHHFQVPLRGDGLIKMQHKGTRLTVQDFPGFNSTMLKDLLEKRDFDIIIMVLDCAVALREEFDLQKDLLRAIREIIQVDSTPLILVVNKVDNLMDYEVQKRLKKVYKAIEEEFDLSDCKQNLENVLNNNNNLSLEYPIVIPMSAKKAFHYRSKAEMSKEEFEKLPYEEIKELARELLGISKLRELEKAAIIEQAYKLSRMGKDKDCLLRESLAATGYPNFEKVIKVFESKSQQGRLLSQQLRKELRKIDVGLNGGYTVEFKKNIEQQRLYDSDVGNNNFPIYKKFVERHILKAKEAFECNPKNSEKLVICMKEIQLFEKMGSLLFSPQEDEDCSMNNEMAEQFEKWISNTMNGIFRAQIDIICERATTEKVVQKEWILQNHEWSENISPIKTMLDHPNLIDHFQTERKRVNPLLTSYLHKDVSAASEGDITDFEWSKVAITLKNFLEGKCKKLEQKNLESKIHLFANRQNEPQLKMLSEIKERQETLQREILNSQKAFQEEMKAKFEIKEKQETFQREILNSQKAFQEEMRRKFDDILSSLQSSNKKQRIEENKMDI